MMPAAVCQALAIPRISLAVPIKLLITGRDALVAPLTIALLEADVITAGMLRHPKNATLAETFGGMSAADLAGRALSKWWDEIIQANSCKFFRWQLHVQRLEAYDDYDGHNDDAWFIFTRMTEDLPRFALEKRVMQLEAKRAGFGQTVLAVLKDASYCLPESFTPWRAVDFAQYYHWRDSVDDAELLEMCREDNGYATVQQVIDNNEVLTREMFFAEMPKWATCPQRVLSRAEIGELDLGLFESRVVSACDDIAALVNQPTFTLTPADRGVYQTHLESTEAAMGLLWSGAGDVIGQVTDDVMNDLYNSGEHSDFIDATPVPMTVDGIRNFQSLTEQTMQLAVLTEKLVLLIGERL